MGNSHKQSPSLATLEMEAYLVLSDTSQQAIWKTQLKGDILSPRTKETFLLHTINLLVLRQTSLTVIIGFCVH